MPQESDLRKVFLTEPATAKDDQIAVLEQDLQKEKDGRKEDRFVFLLVLIIIGDVWSFFYMHVWSAPFALLILEALLLLVVARRLGVDHVAVFMDRLLNKAVEKAKT